MNLDIESLVLASGKHSSPESGMCVMEAVAFLASEKFTDAPACASPANRQETNMNEELIAELRRFADRLVNQPVSRVLKNAADALESREVEPKDEFKYAWLIERQHEDRIEYWMGTGWGHDAESAMWFGNKRSANIVRAVSCNFYGVAEEHAFDIKQPKGDRHSIAGTALAAFRNAVAAAPVVPDGFVLVPVEPTEAMIEQGAVGMASFQDESVWPDSWEPTQVRRMRLDATKAWRYMVAAAQGKPDEL